MENTVSDEHQNHSGWNAASVAGFILLAIFGIIIVWYAYFPEDVFFQDLTYEVLTSGEYLPLEDISTAGKTLQINDTFYPRGIAVHAPTIIETKFIPENYAYFTAEIGLDENSPADTPGSVIFSVIGDGAILYESQIITPDKKPIRIFLPVKNINVLQLKVESSDDTTLGDDAIWAMPRFIYSL